MSFITQLGNWLRKISTSITSLSVSGRTITYTRHNGDTGTIQTQDTTYTIGTASGSGNAITALSISGSTITPTLGETFSESTHTHSYLPLSGGTMTGIVTLNKGDHPAAGELSPVIAVAYKNTANSIARSTYPIDYIGNDNTSNAYNTGIRLGSRDGTTILSAGESGSTFASVLQKYDDENLYLVADGSINLYTNCANDCSSYKGPITITNDTITADNFVGKISGHTVAADVPSNAVFTDTHWTSHLYAGTSSGTAHAATTNGNTHLILCDNSTARNRIKITGTGATTVTSDANGVITINSTDNNTTYSGATTTANGLVTTGEQSWSSTKYIANSSDTGWGITYGSGNSLQTMRFIIGSGHVNRGIWDTRLNKWVFHCDNSKCYVGGYSIEKAVPSNAVFTDTVYTHPTTAGNKHIPSGGSSGQFLKYSSSGTATWAADNNTTYSNMTAASASAAGKAGLVPAPAKGAQAYYLAGNATWKHPNTLLSAMFGTSGVGSIQILTSNTLPTTGTYLYWGRQLHGDNIDEPICGVKAGGTRITSVSNYDFTGWCIRVA